MARVNNGISDRRSWFKTPMHGREVGPEWGDHLRKGTSSSWTWGGLIYETLAGPKPARNFVNTGIRNVRKVIGCLELRLVWARLTIIQWLMYALSSVEPQKCCKVPNWNWRQGTRCCAEPWLQKMNYELSGHPRWCRSRWIGKGHVWVPQPFAHRLSTSCISVWFEWPWQGEQHSPR